MCRLWQYNWRAIQVDLVESPQQLAEVKETVGDLVGVPPEAVIEVSAKTGQGMGSSELNFNVRLTAYSAEGFVASFGSKAARLSSKQHLSPL